MGEHVFPSKEKLRDAAATERSADLLERMLERVSRPDHDWIMIACDAAELAFVAARMAASSPAQMSGHGRHETANPPTTSAEDD